MQRTGEQTDSRSADSLDASLKLIPVDHDPFNDPIDFAELTEILGRPTFAAPVWADQLPPPPPVTTPPNFDAIAPILSCMRDWGVEAHVIDSWLAQHGTTFLEVRACAPRLRIDLEGRLCFVLAGSTQAEVAAEVDFQERMWAQLIDPLGHPTTPWRFH